MDGPAGSGGSVFNQNGGGVFATMWTTSGIKMWYWPRDQIPADITSDKPDSATWGQPYVTFPFGSQCPSYHFKDMTLVINLDFCGDWEGSVFQGGPDACIAYVKDPANVKALAEAYWNINYVKARHHAHRRARARVSLKQTASSKVFPSRTYRASLLGQVFAAGSTMTA